MGTPLKIALLGAESTGKTTLAAAMAAALRAAGHRVAVVPEQLRAWCEREGRAPHPRELLPIAQAQERLADATDAADAAVVIADTTALMVALYGAMLFPDDPLYRFALERQRSYDLTLVTGLDLPWVPDGLQRGGPQVREAVDQQLRQLLADAALPYRVVYGSGPERSRNALAPVLALLGQAPPDDGAAWKRWNWSCDKCGDPDCEHRLFTGLRGAAG